MARCFISIKLGLEQKIVNSINSRSQLLRKWLIVYHECLVQDEGYPLQCSSHCQYLSLAL